MAHRGARSDWVESQVTWNSYKSGFSWISGGGDYSEKDAASAVVPESPGRMTWNVTSQFLYAKSQGIDVELFIRNSIETGAREYSCVYCSNNTAAYPNLMPKLTITYIQ
jgi:hypothetical protein